MLVADHPPVSEYVARKVTFVALRPTAQLLEDRVHVGRCPRAKPGRRVAERVCFVRLTGRVPMKLRVYVKQTADSYVVWARERK